MSLGGFVGRLLSPLQKSAIPARCNLTGITYIENTPNMDINAGNYYSWAEKGLEVSLEGNGREPFLTTQNESHTKEIFNEYSDSRVSHTAFDMLHETGFTLRCKISEQIDLGIKILLINTVQTLIPIELSDMPHEVQQQPAKECQLGCSTEGIASISEWTL